MKPTIENLVFECGGMKGIAYAGAMVALDERGMLDDVARVAGTSAGALMAMMVALRYTPADIRDVLWNSDFSTFNDHPDPLRIATHYGLYLGESFHDWVRARVTDRGFDRKVTFREIRDAGCRDLRVYATDLNTKDAREFSFDKTPDAPVADAVRASMTIPLMYAAWQFEDDNPDDHLYVDGGITMNYPITAFDENAANPSTLGFHLSHAGEIETGLKFNHLFKFVPDLFEVLLRSQVIQLEHSPTTLDRTVVIEDFGISAVDFHLGHEDLQRLFDSGYAATHSYLEGAG